MLRIGIILHARRQDALEYAVQVVRYLKERGVDVCAEDEFARDHFFVLHDIPLLKMIFQKMPYYNPLLSVFQVCGPVF